MTTMDAKSQVDSAGSAEQLCRPRPVAHRRAARSGWAGDLYRRHFPAAHGACGFCPQSPRPCQDPAHRDRCGRACPRCRQGDDRGRGCQALHRAMGCHLDVLSRHEGGAAISDGGRSGLLAGRAGGDGGGANASACGGRGGAGGDRMGGAPGGDAQGNRPRPWDAGAASRARRQSRVPQGDRHRRRRRGLRSSRRGRRGDVQLRAAYRGEPGAAGAACRLRQVHAAADPLHQQPGSAHDPDGVRAHARCAGAQRAGGRARCGRLVRLENSHLRRRGRCDRGGDGARPAGEIHRRPARSRSCRTSMRARTSSPRAWE